MISSASAPQTTRRRRRSDDLRGRGEKKNDEDIVTIRLCGSGFLYNMVRIIAGTLLKVGTGEWEPEHVKEVLEARNRKEAGPDCSGEGADTCGNRV